SLLQKDMLAERPDLEPGQQEIAIMIDAATGVAGKITPGARVNIFATFDGDLQGDKDAGAPESRIIVTNARVIDVGELTSLEDDPDRDERGGPEEAVPITFALETLDAQRLAFAESFAENVRL